MNRRDVLVAIGAALFLRKGFGASDVKISEVSKIKDLEVLEKISDVFKVNPGNLTRYSATSMGVDFPTDLLFDENEESIQDSGDIVTVPLYDPKQDLIDDAINTMIAAAHDRNIVCFDGDVRNKLSKRLFVILDVIKNRNANKTNHWFIIDEKFKKDVPEEYADRIIFYNLEKHTKFYQEDLLGSFPKNKSNLIIAITKSGGTVCPIDEENNQVGFGVLDNRDILLGAF